MKPYTSLSIIFLTLLSLLPPIDFFIKNPINDKWFWMVCISGFFGILTLFINTNWFLRIIAVGGFINCFFSVAPYISFSCYVLLIIGCYFYIIASRIENWDLVINCIKSILILNSIIIFMQIIGKDNLLNFGVGSILPNIEYQRVGIIGQHMQMASFSVILTSLLISSSPWFLIFPITVSIIAHSAWGIISSVIGVIAYSMYKCKLVGITLFVILSILSCIYIIKEGKFNAFIGHGGRVEVWKRTVELSNEHPILGWGIGTFKNVFPPLSKLTSLPYAEAHNCWLQFAFEIGYLGMIFWVILFITLGIKLWNIGGYSLLAGLIMIATDMIGHFPTRQINCVPLLILFAAYCGSQLRRYEPTTK